MYECHCASKTRLGELPAGLHIDGCLAGAVITHSPLTAATRVRYPASACEMVMWSPSQRGGFPPGTPVSSHTKTIRTQTSVPTSMINISYITCFVIVVK